MVVKVTKQITVDMWGYCIDGVITYQLTNTGPKLLQASVTNIYHYPSGTPVTTKDPSWRLGVHRWLFNFINSQTWWATL